LEAIITQDAEIEIQQGNAPNGESQNHFPPPLASIASFKHL